MGQYQDQLGEIGLGFDKVVAQKEAEAAQASATIAGLLDEKADLTAENLALRARIAELENEPPPDPDPEPEPEPEPRKLLVGSSLYREPGEDHQEAYARRCTAFGVEDLEMVRYFWEGMPLGWPVFGDSRVCASFKPPNFDMAGVGSGKYDTQIRNWLNSLPRDKKVRRVALFHEREDDIEKGNYTKAAALAADTRMRKLIDEANARNGTKVTFGIVLMQWTLDPRSGRSIANYLPTDWKYDWMGWDAYPADGANNDLPNLTATKTAYGRCKAATEAHGAGNWFICETGTRNHAGDSAGAYDERQAAWIKGATDIAAELGAKGFMYFDSTVGGDFRIKGPKAKAAMGTAIKA